MSENEQVVETQMESQPELRIVDEKSLPKFFQKHLDSASERLAKLQQEIQTEIEDAAKELMGLMNLSREEGWYLDLENSRFVKVGPVEVQEAEDEVPTEE